jgi:hypothetical protein
MANEGTISWDLRIDGADTTKQQINNVAGSFVDLDTKTRQVTTRFTGVASAGSALGSALSRLNPQVGSIVSAFGSAGGAASGLTTALGGLGGLMGGALIAGVAIAIQYFSQLKTSEEKLEERTLAVEQSVNKLIATYKKEMVEAERALRIRIGAANIEDKIYQRSSAARVQKMLEEKEASSDNYVIQSRLFTLIEKQKQKVAGYDQEIKQLIEDNNTVTVKWIDNTTKATKQIAGAFEANIGNVELRQQEWLERMVSESDAAEQQRLDDWYELEVLKAQAIEEHRKEVEARITANKEEELRKREDAERQANDKMAAVTQRYIDITGNTMAQGLNALAQGKELAIGQIISAIGSELVAAGTRDVLQAAAFFFNPYMMPFAAGLLAAGGAEIAVGMGMGAAGSAVAPSAPGGAAGGKSAPAPSSPTPRGPMGGEEESRPIVINVHTLKADEDAGRAIHESLNKYQKRHGKTASLGRLV